ncbi:hypothetical protein FB451DRAFT_1341251 [Mycena latifolia]|nr:hypothetical protein FB451DRAFT_1341251 [Mycena latifolia]
MALQRALPRYLILFTIASADGVFASIDWKQCFHEIQAAPPGTEGGTDNQGNPVPIANATSITYGMCIQVCGTGSVAFSWAAFSERVSTWLLPWLALLSQFPFGCRYRWDNLMSIVLALGSPCLAAYSLALTVLNTQWVARRFVNCKYPNSRHAVLVLSSLQHTPLKATTEEGLLASLVVLPENDPWWRELAEWLDYADTHTWSVAGATSIAWVVIAYALTIIDAFTSISSGLPFSVSGLGTIWLWMLPLTIGYLQISPRCDSERITSVLNRANRISYVAGPSGAIKADAVTGLRALSLHLGRESLYHDQEATAPIYTYARFFSFTQVVEEFASAFRYASENARRRIAVDAGAAWQVGLDGQIDSANRRGSAAQVEAYCSAPPYVRRSHWGGSGTFSRFFVAAVAALSLQWSTTSASIIILYFTPTVGFGCRSGAYLLYAAVATLIWALLMISTMISHYAEYPDRAHRAVARAAVLLRGVAKVLAGCNAAWILATFLVQSANLDNNCYCAADVLGLAERAHVVLAVGARDVSVAKAAWIGAMVFAGAVSSLYLGFINIYIDPSLLSS